MKDYDYFNKERFVNTLKKKKSKSDVDDSNFDVADVGFELDYEKFREEKMNNDNVFLDDEIKEDSIVIDEGDSKEDSIIVDEK